MRMKLIGMIIASRFLACCSPSNSPAHWMLIASRQRHVLFDSLLCLVNGACEVATAHAELNWNETLIALTKDVRRARIERDRGKLAQWNIRVAVGGLIADLDLVHRLNAVPVFGR